MLTSKASSAPASPATPLSSGKAVAKMPSSKLAFTPSPDLHRGQSSVSSAPPTPQSDADSLEIQKRRRASAEAKLRRMCEPKSVSGKLEVEPDVAKQWQDLAGGRDKLIRLMMEADNSKDVTVLSYMLTHCSIISCMYHAGPLLPEARALQEGRGVQEAADERRLLQRIGHVEEGF